ncbi:MAG: diaminopimelate decarboxylase [Solirubrobacteraceae bacterium]
MATAQSLSHVYPLGSRLNERGCLEIGGCDARELAREFGTPAYFVAEDDLRARAAAFGAALSRRSGSFAVFASKAFPCTAVLELFASEGLGCDVASGGELHLALRAGFDPAQTVFHGNARSAEELQGGVEAGVGLIVLDNCDDVERLERIGAAQAVLVRVTPDVSGDTHEKISTGQADSKFGFDRERAARVIDRVGDGPLNLRGLHMHLGSQLLDLAPLREGVAALAALGDFGVYDLGGGLGVAYEEAQLPPSIEEYAEAMLGAANEQFGAGPQILLEPGRALVANGCVTLYTVQSVKRNVSVWVGVDGGMSDNLRPMLYGARYEAQIVDRFGVGGTRCHVAGKHCESGDVIVRDALLDEPRPGDVIVTPVTGGYGYAMANNYNGVPRAPVVFCSGGDARVVVRRESYEDLHSRDER